MARHQSFVIDPNILQGHVDNITVGLGGIVQNHPVVVADNVFEYCVDQVDNHGGLDCTQHLSNVAPPFSVFFIEANNPIPGTSVSQFGWIVVVLDDDSVDPMSQSLPEIYNELQSRRDQWKWCMSITPVLAFNSGVAAVPMDVGFVMIEDTGKYVGTAGKPGYMHECYAKGGLSEQEWFDACFLVPLVTINFMNCRNVTLADVTEKEGPPKKWLRRRKQPGLTYRTVTIDPEKPKRGHSKGGGIPTKTCPFHIRRGRFATYTDANGSKGLFGRGIYGTFWVPSHTVGDKKHGQTITTYNVKAPA